VDISLFIYLFKRKKNALFPGKCFLVAKDYFQLNKSPIRSGHLIKSWESSYSLTCVSHQRRPGSILSPQYPFDPDLVFISSVPRAFKLRSLFRFSLIPFQILQDPNLHSNLQGNNATTCESYKCTDGEKGAVSRRKEHRG
jgi:hypothetical protein